MFGPIFGRKSIALILLGLTGCIPYVHRDTLPPMHAADLPLLCGPQTNRVLVFPIVSREPVYQAAYQGGARNHPGQPRVLTIGELAQLDSHVSGPTSAALILSPGASVGRVASIDHVYLVTNMAEAIWLRRGSSAWNYDSALRADIGSAWQGALVAFLTKTTPEDQPNPAASFFTPSLPLDAQPSRLLELESEVVRFLLSLPVDVKNRHHDEWERPTPETGGDPTRNCT